MKNLIPIVLIVLLICSCKKKSEEPKPDELNLVTVSSQSLCYDTNADSILTAHRSAGTLVDNDYYRGFKVLLLTDVIKDSVIVGISDFDYNYWNWDTTAVFKGDSLVMRLANYDSIPNGIGGYNAYRVTLFRNIAGYDSTYFKAKYVLGTYGDPISYGEKIVRRQNKIYPKCKDLLTSWDVQKMSKFFE